MVTIYAPLPILHGEINQPHCGHFDTSSGHLIKFSRIREKSMGIVTV